MSIIPNQDKLHVKIDLSNYEDIWGVCRNEGLSNCLGAAYGVTILAGWQTDTWPDGLTEVSLTADHLNIFSDMEDEAGTGELELTLNIGPSNALDLGQAPTISLNDYNSNLHDVRGRQRGVSFEERRRTAVTDLHALCNIGCAGSALPHVPYQGEKELDSWWHDGFPTLDRTFYATRNALDASRAA